METFTTAEAAVAAGVSVREINRAIDEHILPENLLGEASKRRLNASACLLIAFYFSTSGVLTAEARQRAINQALGSGTAWEDWKRWSFEDSSVTVRFESLWRAVDGRLRELAAAHAAIVTDSEILGGTPVLRGTRVPAHDVAAMLEKGAAPEQVLATYPSLTARQLELARVYAQAVPPRGRPRRFTPPHGVQVVTAKRRPLKARAEQQAS